MGEKNECFWSHWVVRIYLFLRIGACFPSHPFQRLFLSKREKQVGIQFLSKILFKYPQTFLLKDDQPSIWRVATWLRYPSHLPPPVRVKWALSSHIIHSLVPT